MELQFITVVSTIFSVAIETKANFAVVKNSMSTTTTTTTVIITTTTTTTITVRFYVIETH